MTEINNHWLYHLTHISNLHGIVEKGLLCDSAMNNGDYVNSGNMNIKAKRKLMPVPSGGCVGDYVPFYYAPRSPMLYTQYINRNINQHEIIYLCTTAERIIASGAKWCGTDRNAAIFNAAFYNTIETMENSVDWALMNSTQWANTEDFPDRMEKRMAEFLVFHSVSITDIIGIGTYDDVAEQRVISILKPKSPIKVAARPRWYY